MAECEAFWMGAAIVGTRRTESGSFSQVIASKKIVETFNLLTKAVKDPNEARQMSSGFNCKLLTKPSVKNDLWEFLSRNMLAIPMALA